MPSEIEALHRAYKDRGLVIWAISARETPERVASWLAEHPISVPVFLDRDGTAADAFRATGTPNFILVDRTGQLVGRGAGPRTWSGERSRALIDALLAEP